MQGKPGKNALRKNEIVFLKDLVGKLIYILGATKYEMERLLEEGGKSSENTELIRQDYSAVMNMLGIEALDPKEAARAEEAKKETEKVEEDGNKKV